MRIAIVFLITLALSLQVSVATICVPQDQVTIQAQLDAELTKMQSEFEALKADMKSRTPQRQPGDDR